MSPSEISRRSMLRGAALGAAALASGAGSCSAEPVYAPPNIVFILADDMGFPTLPVTDGPISALRTSTALRPVECAFCRPTPTPRFARRRAPH